MIECYISFILKLYTPVHELLERLTMMKLSSIQIESSSRIEAQIKKKHKFLFCFDILDSYEIIEILNELVLAVSDRS